MANIIILWDLCKSSQIAIYFSFQKLYGSCKFFDLPKLLKIVPDKIWKSSRNRRVWSVLVCTLLPLQVGLRCERSKPFYGNDSLLRNSRNCQSAQLTTSFLLVAIIITVINVLWHLCLPVALFTSDKLYPNCCQLPEEVDSFARVVLFRVFFRCFGDFFGFLATQTANDWIQKFSSDQSPRLNKQTKREEEKEALLFFSSNPSLRKK